MTETQYIWLLYVVRISLVSSILKLQARPEPRPESEPEQDPGGG